MLSLSHKNLEVYKICRQLIKEEIDSQIEFSVLLDYLKETGLIKLENFAESIFPMRSKMISNLSV